MYETDVWHLLHDAARELIDLFGRLVSLKAPGFDFDRDFDLRVIDHETEFLLSVTGHRLNHFFSKGITLNVSAKARTGFFSSAFGATDLHVTQSVDGFLR